jgi:hypothetical protein
MIEESKHVSRRKVKADGKVGQIMGRSRADTKIRPRKVVKQDITKEEFLAVLNKVCQPISKESNESDSEKSET